jgi:hypothetical protein
MVRGDHARGHHDLGKVVGPQGLQGGPCRREAIVRRSVGERPGAGKRRDEGIDDDGKFGRDGHGQRFLGRSGAREHRRSV